MMTSAKRTRSKTDALRAAREAANTIAAADSENAPRAIVPPAPLPSGVAVAEALIVESVPAAPAETLPVSPPATTSSNAARNRASANYSKRMRMLGPALSRAVQCRRTVVRLQRMAERMSGWNAVRVSSDIVGKDVDVTSLARIELRAAITSLTRTAALLEALPRGWRPAKGAGASSGVDALRVGVLVSVRAKYLRTYEDILEPSDLTGLEVTVVSKKGGTVACKNAQNPRLIFPRAHLMIFDALSSGQLPASYEDEDEDYVDAGEDEDDSDIVEDDAVPAV